MSSIFRYVFRYLAHSGSGHTAKLRYEQGHRMYDLCTFFLDINRERSVKYIVHTDDIVLMCKTPREIQAIYFDVVNTLKNVGLDINLEKVQQGKFATDVLDYCGYRFAGGYVSISAHKIEAFRSTIAGYCTATARSTKMFHERAFIKNINHKINGFGHYYKWGHVTHGFEKLDGYIRSHVRAVYKHMMIPLPSVGELDRLGLRSLVRLKKEQKQPLPKTKLYPHRLPPRGHVQNKVTDVHRLYISWLEKIVHQNAEIIAQLKTLNRHTVESAKIGMPTTALHGGITDTLTRPKHR